MEALLVSSNQGEFNFRVSTMAAAFTGKTKDEKKEIFQLVRRAYDIRSKVAHCAKEIKKPLEGNEIEKLGKIVHEIMLFGFTNGIDKVREEAFNRLLN